MFTLKLALRNVLKTFRRTVLTVISIQIGITACVMTHGFFNWNVGFLRENMIRYGIGHFQLAAKGFEKSGGEEPFKYLIGNPAPAIRDLKKIPGVELATARFAFNGILSSGEKSTVIAGQAGQPENENRLNAYAALTQGTGLRAEKPDGLIIGDGAARKLAAKIGDTLTLMANAQGGGVNAVDLELVGISRLGVLDADNVSASASLERIRRLYAVGNAAQKIVVLLSNTQALETVRPAVAAVAEKYGLEFRTWDELAEFYQGIKLMYDIVFSIIILIVLAVVTFTVSNTVNMKLYDRIREIGTMRSLGTSNLRVAGILMTESALIGAIGGLAGIAGSYLTIALTELAGGIAVTIREEGVLITDRIHFHPDPLAVALFWALFVAVSVIATVTPSLRVSRMSVSDALRWI